MKNDTKKRTALIYIATLLALVACLGIGKAKTNVYNNTIHNSVFSGEQLFSAGDQHTGTVSVKAVPRSSTWGKIFDLNNEGLTENNYQAYTYDFTVMNDTKDKVSAFNFVLTFSTDAFLASAWNGSLEIHQYRDGREIVDLIPDLREFNPANHTLETLTVDGETFVYMKAGDWLLYNPSSTMNAMEVPIEPHEGTTPGIIMYVKMGEDIEQSTLEIEYRFHRRFRSEPLFWVSLTGFFVWLIALIVLGITSAQIKKFRVRHERDNVIINESIETFTGFIDAKDPYTNGHSKRVATYTRLIAKEMGYQGEDLDHIYYIALLHDCGKIGVPDHILGKPGRLTDEEFEIIKSHTVRGGDILSSFKSLENAGEGALYHHERYDGKGYPEGKAGEDIPLIARMICVADSFDAMNTNRVYRNKLTRDHILNEIEKNRGLQFDPEIADIMLKLIRDGKIEISEG